jgi:hypothetical protein
MIVASAVGTLVHGNQSALRIVRAKRDWSGELLFKTSWQSRNIVIDAGGSRTASGAMRRAIAASRLFSILSPERQAADTLGV